MRPIIALLLCSLFAVSAPAQTCNTHKRQFKKPWTWLESNMCQHDYDKWVQPRLKDHWYKDKYFWLGVGVIGASIAADGYTTSKFSNGLYESNPIARTFIGRYPTPRAIAITNSIGFAAIFGLHIVAWKHSHNDPSMAWRQFGRWAGPAIVAGINGRSALHNNWLENGGWPKGEK